MPTISNADIIARVEKGVTYPADATDQLLSARAFCFNDTHVVYAKPAVDAMAADTTLLWVLPLDKKVEILSVSFMPYGSLTSNDTNYATISLEYDDGAGGADTQVAAALTTTTGTGNFTAGTQVNIPLSATPANRVVDGFTARKWLIFKIAKAASGVAVPAGRMVCTWKLVP